MPLPIQNARISKLIHEAYNVVGRYRARIDETVVPVAIVDNLTEGGAFPEIRKASATATIGDVANEHAVWRLETPPNVLAVIRQITLGCGSNAILRVFFGSSVTAPGNIADKAFIDGRVRNRGEEPAAVLSFATQVAAITTTHYLVKVIATNGRVLDNLSWPIGQKSAFDFVEFLDTNVNNAWDIAMVWDEYLISP